MIVVDHAAPFEFFDEVFRCHVQCVVSCSHSFRPCLFLPPPPSAAPRVMGAPRRITPPPDPAPGAVRRPAGFWSAMCFIRSSSLMGRAARISSLTAISSSIIPRRRPARRCASSIPVLLRSISSRSSGVGTLKRMTLSCSSICSKAGTKRGRRSCISCRMASRALPSFSAQRGRSRRRLRAAPRRRAPALRPRPAAPRARPRDQGAARRLGSRLRGGRTVGRGRRCRCVGRRPCGRARRCGDCRRPSVGAAGAGGVAGPLSARLAPESLQASEPVAQRALRGSVLPEPEPEPRTVRRPAARARGADTPRGRSACHFF